MNDLNSVFIVGRVEKVETRKAEDGKAVCAGFTVRNNHYSFNEEKKGYEEESIKFRVVCFGMKSCKWMPKKNLRVGVNGRLSSDKDGVVIVGYSVQNLEASPRRGG